MNKSLVNRFRGQEGRRHLVEALQQQRLVGEKDLAFELAARVRLEEVPAGTTLIVQNASDSDLFLILAGEFSVKINRRVVARRTVGEALVS